MRILLVLPAVALLFLVGCGQKKVDAITSSSAQTEVGSENAKVANPAGHVGR